jgi:hypothetical protein
MQARAALENRDASVSGGEYEAAIAVVPDAAERCDEVSVEDGADTLGG